MGFGKNKKVFIGKLVAKEKHYAVEDVPCGAPGSSVTYSCSYAYSDGAKDKFFKCRVVGEPPFRIELYKKFGRMYVTDGCRFAGNGFSFMDYRDGDEIRPDSILLAVLPAGLAIAVMVLLALIF